MINKHIKYSLAVSILILNLAACKVTKNYQQPQLAGANSLYRGTNNLTDTTSMADLPYQDLFTDPILQNLIEEGLQQNLDLKIALERMKNAAAQLRLSKVDYLPNLNLDLSVSDNK